MTNYSWPTSGRGDDRGDDPRGRARFVAARRRDFDREAALAAGRAPIVPPPATGRRGGRGAAPMGQPTGRHHLWQPLGPTTVLGGQTIGRARIAGRVNQLAVEPINGERIYAASGNGGVWYSGDSGVTWTSMGGFAGVNTVEIDRPVQAFACGAIHVDFGATIDLDKVFVGTGEPWDHALDLVHGQPGQSLYGIGVLVAADPGKLAAVNPFRREAKNLIGASVSRFAQQPGGTTIVAATTIGLLQRPSAPVVDVEWTRVAGKPFSDLTAECTDVLWTAATGSTPERLWVWVRNGDKPGLYVRDAGATDFTKVATPGALAKRAVLAAPKTPTHIFVLNDREANAPALFRVASPIAQPADPPVATAAAVTQTLLGTQGFYDIAMTVDPSNPNTVVLGGCTSAATSADGTALQNYPGVNDAAVLRCTVGTVGSPLAFAATMIGVGVHGDVHDVKFAKNGARLFASCDGGVYRSDSPTKLAGFTDCNSGLSISEANYTASHPTCEGFLVTGLQDNGVIERQSTGVWKVTGFSDAGGVAFDPIKPARYLRQATRGTWCDSGGVWNVNTLLTRGGVHAQNEDNNAAFYSQPASIAHHRTTVPPAAPDVGQVIVGTRRVWYSEDFGTTWVTLPRGSDPLPADTTFTIDDFGESITVCRWQSPDVAWVLGEGKLMRYSRTPGSDAAKGPGTWTRDDIIKRGVKNKKDETSADGPIRDAAVWTDVAVNFNATPGPDGVPGTKGSVYLGTIGHPDKAEVDTLWWFNGASKWFATGLRHEVPAPVTAIACDPDHPGEVFVGTTVGVWMGTRIATAPGWLWEKLVNGLPEAAVEDLSIFSHNGLRLLRAAIASRGTWELRLDVADVDDITYVRAHDDDLRYRARALETKRDLTTPRSWHASPDVRPRLAPYIPPKPTALTRTKASPGSADDLRRFQAALRSAKGDPRVRPTGTWDDYFNEVLRDLGAPTLPFPPAAKAGIVSIDDGFWNAAVTAPHSLREPWGTGVPSEADLYDFTAELREGDLKRASSELPAKAARVEIVVHRRGLDSIDGANVRVTLLKWIDPNKKKAAPWDDESKWPTVNVPWTAAVNDVLNSAGGTTAQTFAGGWSFVGTTVATRRVTLSGQTLAPTSSGIASFDLALTGLKKNSLVLLCAVIRAGTSPADDIALTAKPLKELALTSPNIAVRSLRILP